MGHHLVCATALLLAACATAEVEVEPVELPAGPLSLEGAVDLALRNNPDVRVGRQWVLMAAALVDEAESSYWPDVSLSESFLRTDRPSRVFAGLLDQGRFAPGIDFNDPGGLTDFRLGAGAGVTLYDGGRRKARLTRSEAQLGAAVASAEEAASVIALEVARAWYQTHEARARARLSERAAEVWERQVEFRRAELELGAALAVDVRGLEVRRAEAVAGAAAANEAARRAQTGLGVLLGLGVEERVELADDVPGAPGALPELGELLSRARLARPELERARRDIEAALATLDEVEAGALPQLRLAGDVGFNDPDGALERFNWLFGANLMYGLTEALRTPARSRRAAAAAVAAHEAGRKLLLEIEREVESAWLDAAAAERELGVARAEEERARSVRARAEAERDLGAGRPAARLAIELEHEEARAHARVAGLRRDFARLALAHATGDFPPRNEEHSE